MNKLAILTIPLFLFSLESSSLGAECVEGYYRECYSAPVETQNVGICHVGYQECVGGKWSICQDQQTPSYEDSCFDHLDDNCDGIVNNGCDLTCELVNETGSCAEYKGCIYCAINNGCYNEFQTWSSTHNEDDLQLLLNCIYCDVCEIACAEEQFTCGAVEY